MIDCLSRLSLAGDPRLPFVNYLSYIKRKNEERWADTDTNRESECKKESTYVKERVCMSYVICKNSGKGDR